MRPGGGAAIGLSAWLLGCVTLPPPEAGPPPPPLAPAPPPPPEATAARAPSPAAQATAAAESAAEVALEWNAPTRTIHCGETVALPVPSDLTVYPPANGGDAITVAPPGSPPPGSLIVLAVDEIKESFSFDDLDEMQRRIDARSHQLADAIRRLHAISGGWTTDGDIHSDMRVGDDGVADVVFSLDGAPPLTWRLGVVHLDGCLLMALEQVRPDAAQRFVPMLQRLCAANRSSSKSRCREDRPSLSPPSR